VSKSETPRTDAIHSEKDKEFRDNLTQYRFMHDHAETLEKELTAVTEQRDRLAEALRNCLPFISGEGCGEYQDAKDALQSLTTNSPDQERKSPASDGSKFNPPTSEKI
jgi:hypothetical protein